MLKTILSWVVNAQLCLFRFAYANVHHQHQLSYTCVTEKWENSLICADETKQTDGLRRNDEKWKEDPNGFWKRHNKTHYCSRLCRKNYYELWDSCLPCLSCSALLCFSSATTTTTRLFMIEIIFVNKLWGFCWCNKAVEEEKFSLERDFISFVLAPSCLHGPHAMSSDTFCIVERS